MWHNISPITWASLVAAASSSQMRRELSLKCFELSAQRPKTSKELAVVPFQEKEVKFSPSVTIL